MKSLFTRITGAVLTGVAAATLALTLSGCDRSERQTVINFSHTQAPNSVSDLAAQEFKKYVEEASNGKMRVEIFTNCGLSGGDLTKAIETENLGIHNAGSRQISNSKQEIKTPDDLIGMNIRVPGANVFISLYRTYFGANPTAMDFSEVYTSLQQGAIDGQENPIAVYASSKFDEVQKYVTLWDGVRDTTIWIMSSATLESLTDEEERIVRESAIKLYSGPMTT